MIRKCCPNCNNPLALSWYLLAKDSTQYRCVGCSELLKMKKWPLFHWLGSIASIVLLIAWMELAETFAPWAYGYWLIFGFTIIVGVLMLVELLIPVEKMVELVASEEAHNKPFKPNTGDSGAA